MCDYALGVCCSENRERILGGGIMPACEVSKRRAVRCLRMESEKSQEVVSRGCVVVNGRVKLS